jgi:endonuclease/exonuclease/phosphatase family metal-dependent hydrolase
MALLSRRPWSKVETVQLPEDPRDGDRVAQIGVLPWNGTMVIVANVHLTYLPDADALRRLQLDAVLSQFLLQRPSGVAVICGDFNTRPDGPVLAPLLAGSEGPDLRDAFVAGGGDPGASTLPSRKPQRIDQILSLASAPEQHPVFSDSALVLNRRQPGTNVLPSEHFGVLTTIWIQNQAPALHLP